MNIDQTSVANPIPASETTIAGVGDKKVDAPKRKRKYRNLNKRHLSSLKAQLTKLQKLSKRDKRIPTIKRKIKTLSEKVSFDDYYKRFNEVPTL